MLRQFRWVVALLTALLIPGGPIVNPRVATVGVTPVLAQDPNESICFLKLQSGRMMDLRRICGKGSSPSAAFPAGRMLAPNVAPAPLEDDEEQEPASNTVQTPIRSQTPAPNTRSTPVTNSQPTNPSESVPGDPQPASATPNSRNSSPLPPGFGSQRNLD